MREAFSDRSGDAGVPESTSATGRALVPLTVPAAAPADRPCNIRPDARFVVHLIATATHAPQTRTLRRAAPDDLLTSYAGTSARDLLVAANGLTLSRVA